jgi:hypothetical protein
MLNVRMHRSSVHSLLSQALLPVDSCCRIVVLPSKPEGVRRWHRCELFAFERAFKRYACQPGPQGTGLLIAHGERFSGATHGGDKRQHTVADLPAEHLPGCRAFLKGQDL